MSVVKEEVRRLGVVQYLENQQHKSLLRFLACGSVDDGKSTLIGRLLHDTQQLYEDQLVSLESESKKIGTVSEGLDFALLVDGLQAEREQGITIDVAYRYFSTENRKFIIADTPGHEQYTRNMATGASNCDLAIILVDARYGVQTQTKRHSFICSLLGVKQFVVAINKMDLVDFSEGRFNEICAEYLSFAEELNVDVIQFVPISALMGDNLLKPSENTPWYQGETLLGFLENADVRERSAIEQFRFPVQLVQRPDLNFRGFSGTVASGSIAQGDEVIALPSGKTSKVKRIVTFAGDLTQATAGQAVTLTLEDEIDISRGDVIVATGDNVIKRANQLTAHIVWMAEQPLHEGANFTLKIGHKKVSANVASVVHQVNVNTLEKQDSHEIALNGIALVELNLTETVIVDTYADVPATGSFIMIDHLSNATVAAGVIASAKLQDSVTEHQFSEFELGLNALVREHFPHWNAVDLRALLKK